MEQRISPARQPVPKARAMPGPRILIVDDEPRAGETLRLLLADLYEVDVVTSGAQALERLLGRRAYDVVVCDLMLPDLTGMQLYERLAEAAPEYLRRIVFVTGGAYTEEAVDFTERVPCPVLEKPFTLEELLAAAAGVLAARGRLD